MSLKGVSFVVCFLIVFVSLAWNATAQTPQDLYGRGMQAAQRGQYTQAIRYFQHAIQRDPASAHAYAGLGTVYIQRSQFAEAEVALKQALDIAPGLLQAEANLALLYTRTERNDEAIGLYRKLNQNHPDSLQIQIGLPAPAV